MSDGAGRVDIAANVARIRERIAAATERCGRGPRPVRLVAVSKQMEPERIQAAIAAGVADIGENYVQEAAAKRTEVGNGAQWHLIGHLQRNKAAQAVQIFDMIQTVDSPSIAEAIGRRAQEQGRTLDVLIQVNTSGEESKYGVSPQEVEGLLEAAAGVAGIRVTGLMTIGRWDPDPERARPEFRLLFDLAQKLDGRAGARMEWLSMGMSHDFEVAIEEGANLVRIGTGVFGPRAR